MPTTARPHPPRRSVRFALPTLVAVLALAVAGTALAATPTKRVAKEQESSGGGSVLATLKGRTLYSLSVEKHGKFICTGGCLSVWHPLIVPKDVKPTGPVSLGTVKRPEGKIQVTYRGRPLYTFAQDTGKGATGGEGIKDVGTWHATTLEAAPPPTQPEAPSPYPYPPSSPYPTTPTPSPPTEPPCQYPPYCY
jgi:predicted lipoprotein with Yx(FWY)xxD motif